MSRVVYILFLSASTLTHAQIGNVTYVITTAQEHNDEDSGTDQSHGRLQQRRGDEEPVYRIILGGPLEQRCHDGAVKWRAEALMRRSAKW